MEKAGAKVVSFYSSKCHRLKIFVSTLRVMSVASRH